MKQSFTQFIVLLFVLGSLQASAQRTATQDSLIRRNSGPDFTTSGAKKVSGSKFGYFLKADKETPEEQLAYAHSILAEEKQKKAQKAFRATVKIWPESSEAALAQYEYSKLEEILSSPSKAAQAYEYLFTYYTGSFPHDEALQRLFNLGVDLLHTKKGKFLFFGGFRAPERSIPVFENIIEFGPRWDRAAEAQFLIGQALQENFSYERAISAYERVEIYYRGTPWAEQAAYYKVQCLNRLADESPNSELAMDEAWIGTTLFQQRYPKSDHLPATEIYRSSLLTRRANIAYEQARYYDKLAKRPEAALRAYQEFIKKFPNSEWTNVAKIRIEALTDTVPN